MANNKHHKAQPLRGNYLPKAGPKSSGFKRKTGLNAMSQQPLFDQIEKDKHRLAAEATIAALADKLGVNTLEYEIASRACQLFGNGMRLGEVLQTICVEFSHSRSRAIGIRALKSELAYQLQRPQAALVLS